MKRERCFNRCETIVKGFLADSQWLVIACIGKKATETITIAIVTFICPLNYWWKVIQCAHYSPFTNRPIDQISSVIFSFLSHQFSTFHMNSSKVKTSWTKSNFQFSVIKSITIKKFNFFIIQQSNRCNELLRMNSIRSN